MSSTERKPDLLKKQICKEEEYGCIKQKQDKTESRGTALDSPYQYDKFSSENYSESNNWYELFFLSNNQDL